MEIVSLTFVVALGACISVGLLLAWHLYLVVTNQVRCNLPYFLSAPRVDASLRYMNTYISILIGIMQTTIEFYVNIENKMEAKEQNVEYKNPFDQGFRRNLARLFGEGTAWYYNLIPVKNTPACPLYPLHVMPGVLTGGEDGPAIKV